MSGKLYWEINFIQDSKRLIRPIWKKRKVVAIVEVELFSGGVEARRRETFPLPGSVSSRK
jgi:hypothetical protein